MPNENEVREQETRPRKGIPVWLVALGTLALTGVLWLVALVHALSHLGHPAPHVTLDPLMDALFEQFGFTQLVYVIPIALWAGTTNRRTVLNGVAIAASLTMLINSILWYPQMFR